MRSKLAVCLGFVAMGACGSDPTVVYVIPADAGESSTSISSSSSSSSSSGQVDVPDAEVPEGPFNGFVRRTLRDGKGQTVAIIGITTGPTPHVLYYASKDGTNFALEAVPVTGGAPVVLQAKIGGDDFAYVSGGAVAWYIGTDNLGIADAINIWTPLTGTKTVTTLTHENFFFANQDGSRVAFSVDATVDATSIAVTTSAAPVATAPALSGANTMNWAANLGECFGSLGFVKDIFIGGYCTGVVPTASQPRIVTVDAAGSAVVRVDDAVPANNIFPEWRADDTGTKLLVTTPAFEGRLLVTDGPTTTTDTIGIFQSSVVTGDGLVVFVGEDGFLKKATFTSPPVVTPLVLAAKSELIAVFKNRVIFASARSNNGSDLKEVDDDVVTPTPVTLVATANASFRGVTGDRAHVLFFSPQSGVTATLKAIPIGGGEPIVLDSASRGTVAARVGTGILSITSVTTPPGKPARRFTFKYSDATKGGPLADAARFTTSGDFGFFSGKTFIFTDDDAGLIAVDLP